MATVKELIQAGELAGAVEEATRLVKASPADMGARTSLFELLCIAGEWDRAEKQLDVIGHQSTETEIGVQAYLNNIKAERDRRRLMPEGLAPHFLNEPPAYVDLHMDAINRVREGNVAEARALLDRAEEERPALPGRTGDLVFADFRDYNDFTGSVLELIVKDKYVWLPFEQIASLEIEAPARLRDLVWIPARIGAVDGTVGEVFIPATYPGSSDRPDDAVKLGRMTEWEEVGEGLYRGFGLRTFLVDGDERPVLQVRAVQFDHGAPAKPEAEAAQP
jgi:type VI secretion system protein ImpE